MSLWGLFLFIELIFKVRADNEALAPIFSCKATQETAHICTWMLGCVAALVAACVRACVCVAQFAFQQLDSYLCLHLYLHVQNQWPYMPHCHIATDVAKLGVYGTNNKMQYRQYNQDKYCRNCTKV